MILGFDDLRSWRFAFMTVFVYDRLRFGRFAFLAVYRFSAQNLDNLRDRFTLEKNIAQESRTELKDREQDM